MQRRRFLNAGLLAGMAALFGPKPVTADESFKRLEIDPVTQVFRFTATDRSIGFGDYVEIPWDAIKEGDYLITFATSNGGIECLQCWQAGSSPVGDVGTVLMRSSLDVPTVS